MSRVMYNGKRLIPAPQVTVAKTYQSLPDGTKIGAEWQITINGLFVAFMGSPDSTGTFWTQGGFPDDEVIPENSRLGAVIRKGEALRELFSTDGLELEFQSEDGSAPMKCNPKVQSIQLSEGTWYDRLAYSITMTAPFLSVNGQNVGEDNFDQYIDSADESWQLDTSADEPESFDLPRTYKMSHSVSAKGKRVYNPDGTILSEAWEQARAYVVPKLGLDSSKLQSSGVTDLLPFYNNFNHIRTESIDKTGGGYSVTETWVLASGSALETYQISVQQSLDNALTRVTIDGTVNGLEQRDANMKLTKKKYDNAKALFTTVSGFAFSRASNYLQNVDGSVQLNIQPLSMQVTQMPVAGNISYNFEFDDRPTNLINKARLESIVVTDTLPTDFAVPIFVLGRKQGPVLQDLKTSKETTRTLNIECVMDKSFGPFTANNNPRTAGNIQTIVDSIAPIGNQVYKQDRQETWDIKSGRYTHQITWLWEK